MKKLLLTLAGIGLLTAGASAQLTGTKTIGVDYPTVAAAITDLNTVGVGAGGVIFDVPAGYTETAPAGGFAITASGNATDTIVFRKAGAGANPTFTASAALTVGALNDAIFKLIGADYVTLDGFTMQENAANTVNTPAASNNMTEFGVAMFYASLTNGAQNNTIQNCTITLNRTYLNTIGIYSNTRHSATAVTTSAEVTAASGSNSNNKVYGNTISNVNYGIVFIGAGTTIAAIDSGNDIGGASAATGNTITNWGGGAALSGFVSLTGNNYCIFVNQQINDNISFNTITSAALTSTVTEGGILKNYSIASPTSGTITTTINNNTVTVTNNPTAATTGTVIGINNQGLTPLLATATMSMNNNTVQNCVLGGSTATTAGITGITNLSLPGTMNMNGNSVINNAITATTATSAIINGMSNSGACGTLNMNNNVVRGHASTATSGQPQGLTNSGAVVTAINITNNQLGNASGGFFTTSTATSGGLFGIATSGGATTCTTTITGNDIRGITYNVAATAAQTYYQNSAATLSQNISNNTFTNLNVNTTGNVTFLANNVNAGAGGVKTINGNSIVTAFNKGGAGGTVALYTDGGSSTSTGTHQNNNNNFSNITVTGATAITGFFNNDGTGATPAKTITGNTFSNWTCGSGSVIVLQSNFGNPGSISNNTITNITGTGAITGLLIGTSGTVSALSVSGNTITGLSSTGTGGAVLGIGNGVASTTLASISGNTINTLSSNSTTATVAGISTSAAAAITGNAINTLSVNGSTSGVANGIMATGGTTLNIFKNKIYDLVATGAFTTTPGVNGIVLSGSTASANVTVANNLIGDLRAPAANSTDAIRGLSVTATGATSTYNLYYNTVNVTASSTGTNFGASGVFHATSATATTAALNLRNNVISNTSTANGTGLVAAYRRSSATLTNYASTSNTNAFWAGTPSATNLIYADGTNFDQTLAAYKARVASRDSLSVTEAPPFLSTTGSNVNFLHIDPMIATQLESGGAAIAGITDDFDGNTRNATSPDIGADEFNGIGVDVNPPIISYTPLGNGAAGLNQILTASITDPSGVPTAGAGLPVLYYSINGGAFTPVTAVYGGGSSYSFTFGAAATMAGDIVRYYVVAQDGAAIPNVGAQPSGGASGFTANPPAAATPPTTPSQYTATGTIAGGKTVGVGGDYATLTAAAAALNGNALSGPVTLTLTDATYPSETFPIVINANSGSSASNTITIKPATGVSPTITGSASADCVITVNAADWVVIDGSNSVGGTTRDLTLISANTGTAAVICLKSSGADGATNNVVKNVNVSGSGATGTVYGILSGGATVGTIGTPVLGNGNSSNTIQNNSVSKVQLGIATYGASAGAKNNGNTITQNQIAAASPNQVGKGGILAAFENSLVVSGNNIANISGTTGYAWGIALGLTAVTTTTTTGSEVTNATVSSNLITTVRAASTFGVGGIQVASAATGTNVIVNNVVADVNTNGTASDIGAGIYLGGGAGSTQVYYNSVSMSGTFTGGAFGSFALAINGSNPIVDVRNNIFSSTGSTGANQNRAIALAYTTFTNLTSNYNDLFVSGTTSGVGLTGTLSNTGGTTSTTLANWQTNTGKDANSQGGDPQYNSATNLIPQAGSPVLANGTPISGLTVDVTGATRSATTPSIGAYENGLDAAGPTIAYTALANTTSVANRTLNFTVTDPSGVPTSGAGLPVVYYRKGVSGAFSSATSTSGGGSSYSAVIDYTPVGGVVGGDTIQYFVAAQDNLGNGSANPSAGAAGFTANPPLFATAPTTPSSYKIAAMVAGSYNVGTGETFTSLTNPGGFFEFVNANVVTGDVTANITSDLTGETGSVLLNQWAEDGVGGYTMLIRPSGAPRTVTSTASALDVISLNGADRVTVDGSLSGGTDRSLSFTSTNTATGTTAISILSTGVGAGATNVTIKNCIISAGTIGSTSVTTFGIFVGDTTGAANGADNDNLTIQNNQIRRATIGIQTIGAATGLNDNTVIVDNLIGDATVANSINRIGLNIGQSTGANVARNTIMNVVTTDSAISSSNNARGLILGTGFVNSSVTANVITGIRYASTGGYGGKGIEINTGSATSNVTLANNMVSNIAGDGWNDLTTDSIIGLRILGTTGGINLYDNSVNLSGSFTGNSSGTLSAAFFAAATVTGLDVRGNIFANTLNNTTVTTDKSYAIATAATSNALFTTINYNDYYVAAAAPGVVGLLNAVDRVTLADWQTASGQDLNSISADPLFVSATDLHLQAASPAGNAGVVIAGVTTDLDGNPRSALRPEIGADELPRSANAAALVISVGTLSPVFDTATFAYTDTVGNAVTDVTVTTTAADTNSTIEIQVNGGGYATVASGVASAALPLNIGTNPIDVRITGEGGTPQLTYTITVTRQAVLTAGTLNFDVNQGYSRVITQAEILAAAMFSPGFSPNVTSADAASVNGGTIGLSAGVSVTYNVPAPAFTGADSFNYLLTNSLGQTAMGTININVVAPAFPPKPATVSKSGTSFTATFGNAVPGLLYRVQYSPNLLTAFTDVGTATADGSGNFTLSGTVLITDQKGFFRAITP